MAQLDAGQLDLITAHIGSKLCAPEFQARLNAATPTLPCVLTMTQNLAQQAKDQTAAAQAVKEDADHNFNTWNADMNVVKTKGQ